MMIVVMNMTIQVFQIHLIRWQNLKKEDTTGDQKAEDYIQLGKSIK